MNNLKTSSLAWVSNILREAFLMGAGCGRLYGEFLRTVFGPSIVPGLYAVVGAASLAGGVTRALSCSVLIFEVTGQISHMMPILVAVLLSVTVANSFNQSLYDTLIVMKVRNQDNKRFPEP